MNPFLGGVLSLRSRSVWEAADSGLLLWKNSFVHFIPFFIFPLWVCACGLRLIPADFRYLSYLVLWWVKPFFDRLVLHVVSSRFFGVGKESSPRGFPGNMFRGLLGDLLWRRFSPCRSARMPIRVLERAGRKQFSLRKKALTAGGLEFGFLISAFGLIMETMLLLGEVAFAVMVIQMFFPSLLAYARDNMEVVEVFIFIAFCFNYLLVESLYVCMGFGLYINSRVEVEGWDLQLLFQKFSGLGTARGRDELPASGIGAMLFVCVFLALSPAVYADSGKAGFPRGEMPPLVETPDGGELLKYSPADSPSADGAINDLEAILASPDFGSEKEGWVIRLKDFEEAREIPEVDFSPWFEKIRRVFGFMLRLLVFLAIAGFAVFSVYWLRKNKARGNFRAADAGGKFVNSLSPSESPEKLFEKAEDFFLRGMFRDAWAACLAGCIGACEKYRSLSFPFDATEYGCLERVRSALPAEAEGFGELVRNWVLFAYGGKVPGEGVFERSLAYGHTLLKIPNKAVPEAVSEAAGLGSQSEP